VHSLCRHGCDGSHSWFLRVIRQMNTADEWARSPLIVIVVSCGLDGEEAVVLGTPRTILDMDLDWPLQFLLWY
jgi:hypothetical protein